MQQERETRTTLPLMTSTEEHLLALITTELLHDLADQMEATMVQEEEQLLLLVRPLQVDRTHLDLTEVDQDHLEVLVDHSQMDLQDRVVLLQDQVVRHQDRVEAHQEVHLHPEVEEEGNHTKH